MQEIRDRRERLTSQPVRLGAGRGGAGEAAGPPPEFTPVVMRGRMQPDRSLRIGPRVRSAMGVTKSGHHLVTPLRMDGGGEVLLNRGWVPEGWADPQSARQRVEVQGVVRASERPSSFAPANAPAKGVWFWAEVPAMRRALGLGAGAPYVWVVSDHGTMRTKRPKTAMDVLAFRNKVEPEVETYPLPKDLGQLAEFSVMPYDHLNYALTWFSLSVATAIMATAVLRKGRAGPALARQALKG